mgnify:CR=1 FL=1
MIHKTFRQNICLFLLNLLQIGEFGVLTQPFEFYGTSRTVTLFADDQLGYAFFSEASLL